MKLPPQQLRNFQSKMKEENREAQKWREIEECITYYRKEYEKTVYPKVRFVSHIVRFHGQKRL